MKKSTFHFESLILCAALAFGGTGCSTLKIPAYADGPPSNTAQTLQEENLQVTVDPFFDHQRMREYFKLAPLEGGLVILRLQISNTNSTASYHVQKQKIWLLPSRGGELGAAGKVDTGTAAGEATAMVGATLGSVVVMMAGIKVLSDQTFVRQNLVAKEMPDQTLSPGRTMQGFVYYQLPGKKPVVDGAVLLFTAENASSHQKIEMRFPLRDPKAK